MTDRCEYGDRHLYGVCVHCEWDILQGLIEERRAENDRLQKALAETKPDLELRAQQRRIAEEEADQLAAENERLWDIIRQMVIWTEQGQPCYRTKNDVPQAMPAKVERAVRQWFKQQGPAAAQERGEGD